LARLSPKHGEVIELVYFHGRSVTEIAEIVGIAKATVKTRMFLRAQEVGGVRCHGLGDYHCVAAPA
jgi:RNA polymerase sigma-70 factor, ECF subfamily